MKASALKGQAPLDVNYMDTTMQKDDADLFIGNATSALLETLKPQQKVDFYTHVRKYFTTACDYMMAKFPFRSDAVINAQVSNTAFAMKDGKWENIGFFLKKFPCLLLKESNETDDEAMDKLQSQWLDFQRADDFGPAFTQLSREDEKWAFIAKIKQFGELKYNILAHAMLGILTLPHGNAACERVFSLVRKNKTDFRGSMSSEMMNAILVSKVNLKGPCHSQKFSGGFLIDAKSATSKHLKSSSAASTSNSQLN